mmetsp:Transcript_16427/g.23175  ORF Transcript_16427/g.23175 Transcript_16427/m.23175 type:complete len:348 (-) Transcript_16427:312-1355(-)
MSLCGHPRAPSTKDFGVPYSQREHLLATAAAATNTEFYSPGSANPKMSSFGSNPHTTKLISAEQRELLASRSAARYHGLNPSYFAGVQSVPIRRVPLAYAADPSTMAAYSSYANPSMVAASLSGGMQASTVMPSMGFHPQYDAFQNNVEAAMMSQAATRQALLVGQQNNPLNGGHQLPGQGLPAANDAANEGATGVKEGTKKRRKAGRPAQDEAWNAMFMRLFRYKQENGDCLVPVRYKEDPKLGAWVRNQRIRKHTFSADRRKRLESIGFEWSVKEKQQREIWDTMFSRLLKYRAVHKNCMVPQRYREDPKLGTWVHNQRLRRSNLPQDRRDLLDAVGFAWSAATH